MVKWIKALTLCLWLEATLGQKLERVSGLTFIYWYGLGLDVAKRTRNERTLGERHIGEVSGGAYTVLQPV